MMIEMRTCGLSIVYHKRLILDLKFARFLERRAADIETAGIDHTDARSYRTWRNAADAYSEHVRRMGERWRDLLPSPIANSHYFNGLLVDHIFRKQIEGKGKAQPDRDAQGATAGLPETRRNEP